MRRSAQCKPRVAILEVAVDLSKLPKMSQTPKPPENSALPQPAADPPPVHPAPRYDEPPISAGPEAWFSIIMGLIVILMQQNLVKHLLSFIGGTPPAPFSDGMRTLSYQQTPFLMHDIGIALFGLGLITEGAVLLFVRKPLLIAMSTALMVVATVWNLVTVARFYAMPTYGLQIIPALAVAFGVFVALYQWKLYRYMTRRESAPMT